MNVAQFYNLVAYKKVLAIIANVNVEVQAYEAYKVKKHLVKALKHIAHSQAVSLYPEQKKLKIKMALSEIYKTEQELKTLKISQEKVDEYLTELNDARKILIVLNKKI